jgi:hypothetical protein
MVLDRIDFIVFALTWLLAPPFMMYSQRLWNWVFCAAGADSTATCRLYMCSTPPLMNSELATLYVLVFMCLLLVMALWAFSAALTGWVNRYYGRRIYLAVGHVWRNVDEMNNRYKGD